MLYSIIPPIALILSLIGIIIFLSRKASRVALLDDGRDASGKDRSGEAGFLKRKLFRSNGEGRDLKHGFLFFLEKFTRRLKVFFLKLENIFTNWSENLKRKRKDHAELREADREKMDFSKTESGEDANGKVGADESEAVYKRGIVRVKNMGNPEMARERVVRPIVSERVAVPSSKPEIKNRLERILIERIASNPKDTEAYERLGEYYFEIGNYQHSKECFKQVIKLDPMNANVKDKMKRLERLLVRR